MSIRISHAGLTSRISRSGAMNGDDPVSINGRILPVPPVTPLPPDETYKKMRFGHTGMEPQLKKARRAIAATASTRPPSDRSTDTQTQDDNSSAQFNADPSALASAALASDIIKPSTGKPVHTRKTAIQLRKQNGHPLRKPAKARGRPGLDHDTLPSSDGLLHASDMTSDNTPAVHGPLDPPLPVTKTDSTFPHLLPQPAEAGNRQRVVKLFQN